MHEALFYEKLKNGSVKCRLCPRGCVIKQDKTGFCNVRKNQEGKLYSLVYGKLCSINVDTILKKPLYHFAPGSSCLSISTVGCNLRCLFCQNVEISQTSEIFGEEYSPEDVIEITKKYNLPGIAYTYVEPTIFYEYAFDIMKLARKEGLYNVWVSNGYINPEPAAQLSKYLDAINVDLKGDMKFYQKLCSIPNEDPIRESLKIFKKNGVWIEVTNLIIPGYNDEPEQIKNLVTWVKKNLGVETPLHFSRFHPHHKLRDVEPTPIETLDSATKIAKKAGIKYVYVGNVLGHKLESTHCPKCGQMLIQRTGFDILSFNEKCPKCGEKIKLVGMKWSKIK